MAIKNIVYAQTGLVGVNPSFIYIDTDDTSAEVLTAGYLTQAKQMYGSIFSNKQMALTYTTDGVALYEVVVSGDSVSLQAAIDPGSVTLPVVDGHFANFDGTTGKIKDDGFLPTDATKTRVVMADAATVVGELAAFADVTGTVETTGIAAADVQLNTNIIAATTANIGGAGAGPISVAVAGLTAASVVVATVEASTNPVSVISCTGTATGFDITFSADPGAACTVNYVAFIAAQ